jgi:hypothetical protein
MMRDAVDMGCSLTFVHNDPEEQVEDEDDELCDAVHGPGSTDKGIAKELRRRAYVAPRSSNGNGNQR